MAENENHIEVIQETFLILTENFLKLGASMLDLKTASMVTNNMKNKPRSVMYYMYSKKAVVILLLSIFSGIFIEYSYFDFIKRSFYGTRCFIPNNYLIWEFTRPISNCDYCRGIDGALILPNITKEEFELYAYSSRPIIVKNAASHWPASKVFSLQFFKDLYESIEGAYETVEEECQFLHFKSDFASLRDVFAMSEQRAMNKKNENPWYVGWKNCHPQVLEIMKEFYDVPQFLPNDAEIPHTNYVFLGYEQGAIMHLDYISRLMWQGQILGSKTWTIAPTPECDYVCKRFNFSVDVGDIILLDTRIWYHSTYVENGSFSLTVTSEYGTFMCTSSKHSHLFAIDIRKWIKGCKRP